MRRFGRIATFLCGVIVVVGVLSYPLQASISSYSSLAAWQAANPNTTLEDFSSLPADTYYEPYSTAADGTIQASYVSDGAGPYNTEVYTGSGAGFSSGQYLAESAETYYDNYSFSAGTFYYDCGFDCEYENFSSEFGTTTEEGSITLTPPANTTALGFDVGQVQSYDDQSHYITATITTADNETQLLTIDNTDGTLSFFGFDTSSPITSVTLSVALNPIEYYSQAEGKTTETYNSEWGNNYYDYDTASYAYLDYSQLALGNLMYPAPPPSAVPEPSSWILLLSTSCIGFAIAGRKRLGFLRKTM